jgi:hypothetical protein
MIAGRLDGPGVHEADPKHQIAVLAALGPVVELLLRARPSRTVRAAPPRDSGRGRDHECQSGWSVDGACGPACDPARQGHVWRDGRRRSGWTSTPTEASQSEIDGVRLAGFQADGCLPSIEARSTGNRASSVLRVERYRGRLARHRGRRLALVSQVEGRGERVVLACRESAGLRPAAAASLERYRSVWQSRGLARSAGTITQRDGVPTTYMHARAGLPLSRILADRSARGHAALLFVSLRLRSWEVIVRDARTERQRRTTPSAARRRYSASRFVRSVTFAYLAA